MLTTHENTELSAHFHPATVEWFQQVFPAPTGAQAKSWPAIAAGDNTLLLAPTGSGKTLAAFLVALDRIMFGGPSTDRTPAEKESTRVLYISPLKALGVDVERNLNSPLAGIRACAERSGSSFRTPTVGIRSGDTPSNERARLVRHPPDILITTPESLYLLLTSRARETLVDVESVIVDEIHSLVANKRGAHLFASLERLERLRRSRDPERGAMQRIGLSATQRPLDEVAGLLGGAEATADPDESPRPRPVTIVEAGRRKQLDLVIEVPVEDMTRLAEVDDPRGDASGPSVPSIWPAIHPRLVELIRAHRTTMIFVNSRRLAERLAAAINELADEEIALAHHGSIAKDTRLAIEDRLKRGQLPAIVATSSLELGIDMGAVDLVIQIEAPPSIASGLQRVGRAGHQVGVKSKGIVFPKYRGDLLACSAAAGRMLAGQVEETFAPRNPLDVLAQQLVAMVALGPQSVDDLYATLRGATPFQQLTRSAFENVLDLLAGRYPSDEFYELRPRLTWDRVRGEVSPRKGTQRLAILNGGTIPDRGMYGVFLADGEESEGVTGRSRGGRRVGELDEEMVFETHPGDVFLLGASSWRVLDIDRDRVLVAPAPGEPGRMPFWRGDGPGRPLEFGQAIGELSRELLEMSAEAAESRLVAEHSLGPQAARNLMQYLHEQAEATGVVPSDKQLVIECFLDEVGDWRVAVLSPFGARIHAPWAMAVMSGLARESTGEVDMMWTDDGIMFRLPETESSPDIDRFLPSSSEVEDLVVNNLGSTALFAARFRESAARALLLPRRQPGARTPLWLQRRRAADLLSVASHYPSFPILLESYRECLRDVFDLRGLKSILRRVENRQLRVAKVETSSASPFASTLMFNYVGNFIYDGDAPLAERRAAALSLDHAQLRELLGDAELRELLDTAAVEELRLELQRLDGRYGVRDVDAVHELLLFLGDLSEQEIAARCETGHSLTDWIQELIEARRVIQLTVGGESRFAAAEDTARYRDAVGVVAPLGLPDAFLEPVDRPLEDLVSRFARTHVPFKPEEVAQRLGAAVSDVRQVLADLVDKDRLVAGEFLPGGRGVEYCDVDVLRKLKRRSLAKLRQQIEPVEPRALGRFLLDWHGICHPRAGLDGLLDAIEQLQGLPIPASDLERHVLPARVTDFESADLDELCAAGEIVWQGVDSLGSSDGRVALYLADHLSRLAPQNTPLAEELPSAIRDLLASRGALFFEDITRAVDHFRAEVLDALWDLVWNGEVTNDTLAPLRSLGRQNSTRRARSRPARRFRSRRLAKLPGAEGRWSLLFPTGDEQLPSKTERQTAFAQQLLARHGIVTRDVVASEGAAGGFAGCYPIFKMMEESGRVRRGYFVAGLGAAQFALPGAEDRVRHSHGEDDTVFVLAATDPANPFGAALRWPEETSENARGRLARSAGARVVIAEGQLVGYIGPGGKNLTTLLPTAEPERRRVSEQLAAGLASLATESTPVWFEKIDGQTAPSADFAAELEAHGFVRTSRGMLRRREVER